MINHSFLFLDGIGRKKEEKLWSVGIKTWDDFLNVESIPGISFQRKAYYDRKLTEAKTALREQNLGFFVSCLPVSEMWRLYPVFRDACCFLDVEVDSRGRIIVLTLFDRFQSQTFVRGAHLEKDVVERVLSSYKLLVTFNGSAFDVPKLQKDLGIVVRIPHLDLKPLCQRLGLRGGLKNVEKALGIPRPSHLKGHPVDLWKVFWASGDNEWLELLVQYNEEDAVNLYWLAEACVARMQERFGLLLRNS